MTAEVKNQMARIISANILTPVIYMIENGDVIDFICLCDRNITMQEIYDVENKIKEETGHLAEIIDIREFNESERLEIINHATLIHSEHPIIENIFAQSMAEDFRMAMARRQYMLERVKTTGTWYLQ